MKYILSIILLLLASASPAQAQGNVRLKTVVSDDSQFFKKNKKYQLRNEYDNDLKATKALQGLILQLYADGFVTASVDSETNEGKTKTAYLFIGKRYEWLDLRRAM